MSVFCCFSTALQTLVPTVCGMASESVVRPPDVENYGHGFYLNVWPSGSLHTNVTVSAHTDNAVSCTRCILERSTVLSSWYWQGIQHTELVQVNDEGNKTMR